MDPGSTREFEIFSEPSCEFDAECRIIFIGEPARIAHFVKAFFIERNGSEVRLLPISGRDVWPPDAQLVSARVVHWHHLQFTARCRQADDACSNRLIMHQRD